MKIAIPTKNNNVDSHFGHCDHYIIYTISKNNTISDEEKYVAPKGCGCKSNVATMLAAKGVTTLLAGNMGNGAVTKIKEQNITVVRGCEGNVEEVAVKYLAGNIDDSGELCTSHGDDHECSSTLDTNSISMMK